ncbi:hypothetical protein [Bdellovibrio sp. KM01]|uniref:hypothetical protein n=1 Tax=Bdellovibrio sp. KM01 TaxID=2748865 RepID=UPI0015EAE150|nr:hypothetical protein [Bdellovibrio sp. KM01]QLY26327.1 hypothetical protein HW988_04670 [Bdellovibrio sp. KM01]
MMDIEPEIRKEQRRIREQRFADDDDEGPEEVEGMTERPHRTHELESSPLKVFSGVVGVCLASGLLIGAIIWIFFV